MAMKVCVAKLPRLTLRGRYKAWPFTAILLLTFWSIATGIVTLRWSSAHLDNLSDRDSIDFPLPDDLDLLEMEEREKLVRHMWDVYTSNGRRIGLVKFWEEAFKSAYEEMTSDVPVSGTAPFSEIAKMSLHSIRLESPSFNSMTKIEPDFVLFLDCQEEEMIKRLLSRNQGREDLLKRFLNQLRPFSLQHKKM